MISTSASITAVSAVIIFAKSILRFRWQTHAGRRIGIVGIAGGQFESASADQEPGQRANCWLGLGCSQLRNLLDKSSHAVRFADLEVAITARAS